MRRSRPFLPRRASPHPRPVVCPGREGDVVKVGRRGLQLLPRLQLRPAVHARSRLGAGDDRFPIGSQSDGSDRRICGPGCWCQEANGKTEGDEFAEFRVHGRVLLWSLSARFRHGEVGRLASRRPPVHPDPHGPGSRTARPRCKESGERLAARPRGRLGPDPPVLGPGGPNPAPGGSARSLRLGPRFVSAPAVAYLAAFAWA